MAEWGQGETRALSIALLLTGRNRQPFYLSAGDLLELWLPTFSRPGDEKQDQAVPGLTEFVVGRAFHAPDDSGGAN
jgi:hypothetical protein